MLSKEITENECAKAAKDGEPVFILLGRDPDAFEVVAFWASLREKREGQTAKVMSAYDRADEMLEYHGNLCL